MRRKRKQRKENGKREQRKRTRSSVLLELPGAKENFPSMPYLLPCPSLRLSIFLWVSPLSACLPTKDSWWGSVWWWPKLTCVFLGPWPAPKLHWSQPSSLGGPGQLLSSQGCVKASEPEARAPPIGPFCRSFLFSAEHLRTIPFLQWRQNPTMSAHSACCTYTSETQKWSLVPKGLFQVTQFPEGFWSSHSGPNHVCQIQLPSVQCHSSIRCWHSWGICPCLSSATS